MHFVKKLTIIDNYLFDLNKKKPAQMNEQVSYI